MSACCWVLRDSQDRPWDDEHDVHYDTAKEAQATIGDLVDEEIADAIPAELTTGTVRASNLRPIQLDAPCLTLACSVCEEEYDDDEFAHVHFPTRADLDRCAEASGWRLVNGQWRCFDCPTTEDEDEDERTGPDAYRWQPGPNDVPLPLEVSP